MVLQCVDFRSLDSAPHFWNTDIPIFFPQDVIHRGDSANEIWLFVVDFFGGHLDLPIGQHFLAIAVIRYIQSTIVYYPYTVDANRTGALIEADLSLYSKNNRGKIKLRDSSDRSIGIVVVVDALSGLVGARPIKSKA